LLKRLLFLLAIIVFVFQGESHEEQVWAAEYPEIKVDTQKSEVIIRSEIAIDEKDNYRPDESYTDQDGKEFWLKEWHIESLYLPERKEWTVQAVDYKEVEWAEQIPEQTPITIKDKVTGQTVRRNFPIYQIQHNNEQWVPGFSFTAVFHSYDADYYQLGGKKIPYDNKKPQIKDCYTELLNEIQVDPEKYRITDAAWEGEPYVGEGGIICRNALVTGEKKVSDYHVTYGGEAILPSFQGNQCVAVYRGFNSVTDGWDQAEEDRVNSGGSTENNKKGSWVIFRRSVVVTFSILLIIGAIVLAVSLKRRLKRNKRRKEIDHEDFY
jgi:hypothetical protein